MADNIWLKFFKSRNVKIFPCSHRGNYVPVTQMDPVTGQSSQQASIRTVFDPESRMLSEYNFTSLSSNLFGKKSKVIEVSFVNSDAVLLKLTIDGYYFEISLNKDDLNYYFGINITGEISASTLEGTIIPDLQKSSRKFYIHKTKTQVISGANIVDEDNPEEKLADLDRCDSERRLQYLGSLLQLYRADDDKGNFGSSDDGYVAAFQDAGLDITQGLDYPYYCVAIAIDTDTIDDEDENLVCLDTESVDTGNNLVEFALGTLDNWYGVYYTANTETLNLSFM